jgi:peptidyl-prolyl cis-trans isomerase C
MRPIDGAPGSATSTRDTAAASPRPSRLRRWLREPLLQFLVVGLLLFAAYRVLNPDAGMRAPPNQIVLTQDDLRQMSVAWLAQGRPPPTPEQWRSLIEAKVREEVLFREALALGLDQGDTIVKRRMVQKMEFLAQDMSAVTDPKPAQLKAWFDRDPERFAQPPRVSFRLLYFSPDRRGVRARDDAQKALQKLSTQPKDSPKTAALSDPFMFQDYYADRSPEQMAKQFGPPFAQALFGLKPGLWQGPIESGYGWHLIFMDSLTPERVPAYEEVEPEVKAEWIAEQAEQAKSKAYEAMRARYQVVLPEPPSAVQR